MLYCILMLSLWHKPDTPQEVLQCSIRYSCVVDVMDVTDVLSVKSASNPQMLCFISYHFAAQHVALTCIDTDVCHCTV